MHIVPQFTRFLTFDIEFLKTVIYKLFEFMKNKLKGIKDMACIIFLKISKQCKNELIKPHFSRKDQSNQQLPRFVMLPIPQVHMETLDTFHRIQFYEAMGNMISALPGVDAQIQLMGSNEQVWQNMMAGLDNLQHFKNDQILTEINSYLRINERLTECIGKPYNGYLQPLLLPDRQALPVHPERGRRQGPGRLPAHQRQEVPGGSLRPAQPAPDLREGLCQPPGGVHQQLRRADPVHAELLLGRNH